MGNGIAKIAAGVGLAVAVAALAPLALNQWHELAARRAREALARQHARAAAAALERGDRGRAVVAWQRAWDLDRSDPALLRALVRAQAVLVSHEPESLGDRPAPDLAHELALAVEEGVPDPAVYLTALGNVARVAGRTDEAVRRYDQAVEVDPRFALAWYWKGRLLLAEGRAADAELPLRKAVEIDGEDWRFRRALGEALRAKGDRERALPELQKAADLERSFENLRLLGAVQVEAEQFSRAITTLEAAATLARRPEDVARSGLHGDLGFAYLRVERVREAVDELKKAVRAEPSQANLYNLGTAHQTLEDHADAVPIFEELVRRHPLFPDGHVRLIVSLVKSGQTQTARAAAQRFLNLAARDTQMAPHVERVRTLLKQLDELEAAR